MTNNAVLARLSAALETALVAVGAPEGFSPTLERPRDPSHGDWASNAALVLGGRLGQPPRRLAKRVCEAIDREAAGVASVEVAGPGFLNFRLSDRAIWPRLAEILEADAAWGRSRAAQPQRVNVEFVSANPTGPLHVAHGRGAALGDAVASLLEWTGHEVTREFYVNDAGRQIELLAESVEARYEEASGRPATIPEGGYHGEYVREVAGTIREAAGAETLASLSREARKARFRSDVAIPVTPNAEVFHRSNPDRPEVVDVPLSVLYQVCSETICYTPRTETLTLAAPFQPLLSPGARRAR